MCISCVFSQIITGHTANITMYNITAMDQHSSAIVTVPVNMSSVEIGQFPYNGTSIVANREYTITVSAISDQGTSCPSDPVVAGECSQFYVLKVKDQILIVDNLST